MPLALAIQSPSPTDSVARHGPPGRPQHAPVVRAEPEDDVVGHDRRPHRAVAVRNLRHRCVQRRRRDPVRRGIDLHHPAVLGARHPHRAAGKDQRVRGEGSQDALLRPRRGWVHAHRLRPARDPHRAGAEGDARRARIAIAPDRTENASTIRPVSPSRRTSPGPSSSVTHAAPAPVAMAPGVKGSLVDESTLRDARSTRATRRSSPSSTHAGAVERHVPRLAREWDLALRPRATARRSAPSSSARSRGAAPGCPPPSSC